MVVELQGLNSSSQGERPRTLTTVDATASSAAPDGGYGWVCVVACFLVNCFTWGAVSAYGVYLSHYLADNTFPNTSSLNYALVGGLNFTMAMLVAPIVTIITRLYSTALPMALGCLLLSGGFIAASFAHTIWQLYLTQGILVGLGVGFTYVPSIAVISQWFGKKRSLANGISSAGSGIGGLLYSFLTEAIISRVSLAWALRVTALISGVFLILATVLIRTRNEAIQPTQRGFDVQLLKRADSLLLLSWAFISMLGYMMLLFSLPDFARSIGLSAEQASVVNAILSLGTAIGRPLIGFASDYFGRINVAGALTSVCGVLCFALWLPATSYGLLIFFALIIGGIFGVFWMTIGPLCVEVAGIAELQSLLSLSWLAVVLPCTFSEVIALELRRPNTSSEYLFPQLFCGLSYLCAGLCLYFLRLSVRRRPVR